MGNCKSKKQDSTDYNNQDQSHEHKERQNGHDSFASHHSDHLDTFRKAPRTMQPCNHSNLDSGLSKMNTSNQNPSWTASPSPSSAHLSGGKTSNETVIESTRAEVASLLQGISTFQGVSQEDKNYRYYDEMLTRCILGLDQMECESAQDKCNRKGAIGDVNQAIDILERKLAINTEIRDLEQALGRQK